MKTTAALIAMTILSLTAFAQQPPTVHPQPTLTDKKGEVMDDIKGTIKQAHVFFIEPKDGATVSQKFHVKMGIDGIKLRPAGEAPDEMTSGHHHLVIDSEPIAAGQPVPNDEKHLHFGKGQTETDLTLPPGKHTLILQLADGAHRSFGPKLMQKIEITVKK